MCQLGLTVSVVLQGFNQEDLEDKKETTERQQQQMEYSDSDEGIDRSGQEYIPSTVLSFVMSCCHVL